MSSFTKYLQLPAECTDLEIKYLKRVNWIVCFFYYAHLPLLIAIAASSGEISIAVILMCLIFLGPTLACYYLPQQRLISRVYDCTAMNLGEKFVYFVEGPLQNLVHLYVFALLPMICIFAYPMVNIITATTLAIQQVMLWLIFPSSVFNYAMTTEVFGVQTALVVVETLVACFIARLLFANGIQRENDRQVSRFELKLAEQNKSLILDNLDQALFTVSLDGVLCQKPALLLPIHNKECNDVAHLECLIQSIQSNTNIVEAQLMLSIKDAGKSINWQAIAAKVKRIQAVDLRYVMQLRMNASNVLQTKPSGI